MDALSNEDVQRLKHRLADKSPKTVNNILTVLSVLLKQAVEWGVIDRLPCSIKLLRVSRTEASFHDFDNYERLVEAACSIGWQTHLIALLGGDAGLRVGEIVALQWADVDFGRGQFCVRHSDWRGQLTSPKNGRARWVRMTARLAAALRQHRHLRSTRVLCKEHGEPVTRQGAWSRVRYAARRAGLPTGVHNLAPHVLLALGDARRTDACRPRIGWTPGSDDDPAVFAPQSACLGRCDSLARRPGNPGP